MDFHSKIPDRQALKPFYRYGVVSNCNSQTISLYSDNNQPIVMLLSYNDFCKSINRSLPSGIYKYPNKLGNYKNQTLYIHISYSDFV